MVDLPEGWRYGFPKEYTCTDPDKIDNWLVDSGYPQKEVEFGKQYLRFFEIEDES